MTIPGNINKACPYAVQSKHLSVLELKSAPTSVKQDGPGSDTYTGEAVFSIQSDSGFDKSPHDEEATVRVTVKLGRYDGLLVTLSQREWSSLHEQRRTGNDDAPARTPQGRF